MSDDFSFAVRYVRKDEKKYYEELLRYSREHLMLYPYHLSDVVVKGLRVTPFAYYISIMCDIMTQEKSYDSLPNFTAADCKCIMSYHLVQRRNPGKYLPREYHRDPLLIQCGLNNNQSTCLVRLYRKLNLISPLRYSTVFDKTKGKNAVVISGPWKANS